MKLSGLLATAVFAKEQRWDNGAKGGKHGRVQISEDNDSDRLLLHFPMCMKYPDHVNCVHEDWCEQTFTSKSGSISVDSSKYNSKVSCLWQFDLPPNYTLEFQFVGDFDLEYHQKCGYDRVHIFSGEIDGDMQRQGRFCGPKAGRGFPHDGTGNHIAMGDSMDFFTQPFDIRSNTAFVGFDADQSFIGSGFTLEWNAVKMYKYDFTDVFESHQFVTETAAFLFTKVQFATVREKRVYGKQLKGRITASSLRALQNNPDSDGPKRRRCAVGQNTSVSDATVQLMKDLADNESPDFRDAMEALSALITEYLGNCRVGGEKWPVRVSEYADDVEGDRTL
jgi:hypothetical protein